MPDYVDHLSNAIALATKAIQESRVAMETQSRMDLNFKLALVSELFLKAHTEILEAVKGLNPK